MLTAQEADARIETTLPVLFQVFGKNWFQEIDLKRLDLSNPRNCVLGQLLGSWAAARRMMIAHRIGLDQLVGLFVETDSIRVMMEGYERLTKGWKKKIRQLRLEAAV